MNNTHNTISHAEGHPTTGGSEGEQDEPDSSCDPDNPPEPSGMLHEHHTPEDEAGRLEVIASESCDGAEPDLDWIRLKLDAALALLEQDVARITVRLVDDVEMTALHKRHSAIDETTDVLTFVASDPGTPLETDIAVCVDDALRRAADLGHGVERELVLYALHGILHGLGFDDHEDEDYRAMHAEEDRILEAIGVGAVFRSPGSPES